VTNQPPRVADWIDANQLGRRNLTPDAFKMLLGRRYNRTKKSKAEAGKIGGSSKDQIDPCLPSTAQSLAQTHGVSAGTTPARTPPEGRTISSGP
jgi:hypothetical protein